MHIPLRVSSVWDLFCLTIDAGESKQVGGSEGGMVVPLGTSRQEKWAKDCWPWKVARRVAKLSEEGDKKEGCDKEGCEED
eukprot:1134409-Pelagomonas_calceolata.AAC.4